MNLSKQLLISLPDMQDPRFHKSVILICEHDESGAMGLILNKTTDITTDTVFSELSLNKPSITQPTFSGGPLNEDCGFILHNNNQLFNSSICINKELTLTTSKDLLERISGNNIDFKWKFILGYSGWSAKQLESEIQQNAWLTCPLDTQLIFNCKAEEMWKKAMKLIGIKNINNIAEAGHA